MKIGHTFLPLFVFLPVAFAPSEPIVVQNTYAEIPQVITVDKEHTGTTTPEQNTAPVFCSCIKGARFEGVPLPPGDAKDLIPHGPPVVGGIVILRYLHKETQDWIYHVAVISALNSFTMSVIEYNFEPCKRTEREIPYDDPHITGFWTTYNP